MKVIKLTSTANANSFFDNIIPNLQAFIAGNSLDPLDLPELDAEVQSEFIVQRDSTAGFELKQNWENCAFWQFK